MSESEPADEPLIDVEPMSVDQLAGAFVMIAGAIGSLLLVIWQSKCHCRMNLCYIFSCERRPPNEEEMKSLKDQAKKQNQKLKNMNKKEDTIINKEDEIIKLQRKDSMVITEPEPEPEIFKDKSSI
jgi:hypothetical protein|tara:strand:+ start:34 stop:411 length:378 start_codon:yes stop_codon:yes gene_type:complete